MAVIKVQAIMSSTIITCKKKVDINTMIFGYFWNNEEPDYKSIGRFVEKRIEDGHMYYVDQQSIYWDNFKESKEAEKEFVKCN
jgi:hypothetical protein